jgi:hypothetical protein
VTYWQWPEFTRELSINKPLDSVAMGQMVMKILNTSCSTHLIKNGNVTPFQETVYRIIRIYACMSVKPSDD